MTRLHATSKKRTAVYWPELVDQYLDVLLEAACDAGADASRAQLLAALVLEAPKQGSELERLVTRYRSAERSLLDGRLAGHPVLTATPRTGPRTFDRAAPNARSNPD